MTPAFKAILSSVVLLILVTAGARGQSLGDVAREQRLKQQKTGQAQAKVITNDDLGEPDDGSAKNSDQPAKQNDPSKPLGSKTAKEWTAEIEAQKTAIAKLQSRIEKVNSSVRFTRTSQTWNAVRHNEHQEEKLDEVQQMQNQLVEEQRKLDEMQESVRREGFGSSVYDPN